MQHVEGADSLLGAFVHSVEDISLPDVEDPCDVSDVWGHKVRIDKGYFVIEMRVDHNGYYGGSLYFSKVKTIPDNAYALVDF